MRSITLGSLVNTDDLNPPARSVAATNSHCPCESTLPVAEISKSDASTNIAMQNPNNQAVVRS